MQVSNVVKGYLDQNGIKNQLIDLNKVSFKELDGSQYSKNKPQSINEATEKLLQSQGYLIIAPEYNGSIPGVLKYFIDHWEYPKTFEYIPVAFIGLGGRFGGVRPVEHLQQVFAYRNGFIFPERVFIFNAWDVVKDGKVNDPVTEKLLEKQALDFSRFIDALLKAQLHAQTRG